MAVLDCGDDDGSAEAELHIELIAAAAVAAEDVVEGVEEDVE